MLGGLVMCDAFEDYGRKIGEDPVGFKCTSEAETQVRVGGKLRSVRMRHRRMLDDDPVRISFCEESHRMSR
jgi:hypothetical protein